MSITLSRAVKEALLDGAADSKNPFEKIGYQSFVKFDAVTIETDGSVRFSYRRGDVFTINPEAGFILGEMTLTITGIEGRMAFSI